jgi:hypothetical protein
MKEKASGKKFCSFKFHYICSDVLVFSGSMHVKEGYFVIYF